jgi:hypothetical protein
MRESYPLLLAILDLRISGPSSNTQLKTRRDADRESQNPPPSLLIERHPAAPGPRFFVLFARTDGSRDGVRSLTCPTTAWTISAPFRPGSCYAPVLSAL